VAASPSPFNLGKKPNRSRLSETTQEFHRACRITRSAIMGCVAPAGPHQQVVDQSRLLDLPGDRGFENGRLPNLRTRHKN
jgi:hypothetical protein